MVASSSATALRRSPLVTALAVLASAVAAWALLLVLRSRAGGPAPGTVHDHPPPSAAVQARPPGGAGARVPRFVPPLDHTAVQRAELAEVDRQARARAAAEVGLNPAEAQKAESVYRAGDRRRDQLEAELDDDTIVKPSLRSPSRLWRHEAGVLAEMNAALGQARADALRAAEAAAYEELIRQVESRPGRTFPMNRPVARRRSSAMLYLQAAIEAAQDPEHGVKESPVQGVP